MSVQDVIKKSVLESGMFDGTSAVKIGLGLIAALILGAIIYFVYKNTTAFHCGVCVCYLLRFA